MKDDAFSVTGYINVQERAVVGNLCSMCMLLITVTCRAAVGFNRIWKKASPRNPVAEQE